MDKTSTTLAWWTASTCQCQYPHKGEPVSAKPRLALPMSTPTALPCYKWRALMAKWSLARVRVCNSMSHNTVAPLLMTSQRHVHPPTTRRSSRTCALRLIAMLTTMWTAHLLALTDLATRSLSVLIKIYIEENYIDSLSTLLITIATIKDENYVWSSLSIWHTLCCQDGDVLSEKLYLLK